MEFGQIPRQVFKQPHPARICLTLELENRFARSVENTGNSIIVYFIAECVKKL